MATAAVALARQQRYAGAGTVEFIVDARTHEFFFLEMNTRIQVEHPVTEMVTGVDLVALQLKLAGGDPLHALDQQAVQASGHAVECRIYAENPAKMFLPSPGRLNRLVLPAPGPGVRIDTGVREGDTITAYYDPMIAKLICFGPDRDAALDAMQAALDASAIEGIAHNIDFLGRVLRHSAFRSGEVFTGFIDSFKADLLG
jgi:3-methylcrotonyl-CoA carboxylase alpha subunit